MPFLLDKYFRSYTFSIPLTQTSYTWTAVSQQTQCVSQCDKNSYLEKEVLSVDKTIAYK